MGDKADGPRRERTASFSSSHSSDCFIVAEEKPYRERTPIELTDSESEIEVNEEVKEEEKGDSNIDNKRDAHESPTSSTSTSQPIAIHSRNTATAIPPCISSPTTPSSDSDCLVIFEFTKLRNPLATKPHYDDEKSRSKLKKKKKTKKHKQDQKSKKKEKHRQRQTSEHLSDIDDSGPKERPINRLSPNKQSRDRAATITRREDNSTESDIDEGTTPGGRNTLLTISSETVVSVRDEEGGVQQINCSSNAEPVHKVKKSKSKESKKRSNSSENTVSFAEESPKRSRVEGSRRGQLPSGTNWFLDYTRDNSIRHEETKCVSAGTSYIRKKVRRYFDQKNITVKYQEKGTNKSCKKHNKGHKNADK